MMVAFSSWKDDNRGKISWIIKGPQVKRDLVGVGGDGRIDW